MSFGLCESITEEKLAMNLELCESIIEETNSEGSLLLDCHLSHACSGLLLLLLVFLELRVQ